MAVYKARPSLTFGMGQYHSARIHTTRGVIDIKDIRPGDFVYEYKTSRILEVKGVQQPEVTEEGAQSVWEITFNDGRRMYLNEYDLIYAGDTILPLRELFPAVKAVPIVQYPTVFQDTKYNIHVNPDPYAAAAFLVYGDHMDECINLPLRCNAADAFLVNKYNMGLHNMSFDSISNGTKLYYHFNGTPNPSTITWKEFFPDSVCFATTRDPSQPVFPIEYVTASINDRKKFVRSAFDMGFTPGAFPHGVGTTHWDEFMLERLQWMLCSLGVLSKICYDPFMNTMDGRAYRLDVLGVYDGYPGFFYDVDSIEQQLKMDNILFWHPEEKFELRISGMRKIVSSGFMCNILLEKPHMLYMTENFLPKVSL